MNTLDRFRLDGRTLLITGGSQGLGREMALACADAGADVVLIGRSRQTLDSTAREIEERGSQAYPVVGDVSRPEDCEKLSQSILSQHQIDILINNVGGRRINVPLEEQTLAQWQQILDLNLTSMFLLTRDVGGRLKAEGREGTIINIASISGLVANANIGGISYEVAKAAAIQFTRAAAVQWAKDKIRVNAICPGGFMTEPNQKWAKENPEVIEKFSKMIPIGSYGAPEDIGPLVVYLASNASSYMTGATVVLDGGYTLC
ncbi:MAG: SDR family NAD(P)-dependent oxidoreductase [Planctomycetaceae bacterium]|jgi:NAD(P)-dependent dehydrogenase (short-subunit alcohol dehydrogenase family)|nr:SDR family NAD(P)-dependent oxidoreductase [Planctomycetaceae bacterium]